VGFTITHSGGSPWAGLGDAGQAALVSQPGQFANAFANAFGGYGQGMAGVASGMGQLGVGMGNAIGGHSQGLAGHSGAVANNYNAFAGGNAAIANALANERASAYGAMSQAEAARQLAAGNIANQSLAAYGGMGNAAMAAWAQNQSSYNQSLQNMFTGNQLAASQLGQSRNQALSGLGDSTSSLGRALAAAGVIGNMDFGLGGTGGMGFEATGPGGPVASGSYGGGMGGMSGGGPRGPGPEFSSTADRSFGMLDSLRGGVMDNTFLDNLENARQDGFNRLDRQHYTSRTMPFDFMGTAFNDLQNLARPGYAATRQGMDQLYGNINANRADFSDFTRALQGGFDTSSQDLRDNAGRMSADFQSGMGQLGGVLGGLQGVASNLGSGLSSTQGSLRDLFSNTLGNMPAFQSPLQRQQAEWELQDARRERNAARATRAAPATNPIFFARGGR